MFKFLKKNSKNKGFTRTYKYVYGFSLIESMIGIVIFTLLAGATYQTFMAVSKTIVLDRENTTIANLADQYLEIARNLPYAQIGTTQGNPNGALPDYANLKTAIVGATTYQIYYEVTYTDDPADGLFISGTDMSAPNDYKQVKLSIKNTTTGRITNFVTNIVPSGLEGMTSGGALWIHVIDAVGQPVAGASITITNSTISPSINLNRTSSNVSGGIGGDWVEVGLPDSANSYHIVVTKNGYSTDQTYAISGGNPNPVKGDSTIANGQVTDITFSIDLLSNLTFNTLNTTCQAISSVGIGVNGTKLIGTPSLLKFSNTYNSNGGGQVALNNIEWDNYTPALTGNSYMIFGSSPIQQINLLPSTTQSFNLILGAKTTNSFLAIVKDKATNNAIEGANVRLTNSSLGLDTDIDTGGSLFGQQFWNGGGGQDSFSNTTQYYSDDGNIDTTSTPLAMRLKFDANGTTVNSGTLTSSTFDTGTNSTTYTTIEWLPASQDPSATVKFQVATNNDNSTWNFYGPDGTASTYYTTSGTTLNSNNNNKRYVRYKIFLSTTDTTKNPTITSVNINYVSGCFTPGQVMFPGLTADNNYQLDVSMSGYTTKTITGLNITGYQTLTILLAP